jgi:rRNA-processing protein FCF1
MQETPSKQQLDELGFYEIKLRPFDGIGKQGETVELTLNLIKNYRDERMARLEEHQLAQLDRIEADLENIIDEKSFGEIQKNLTNITAEIIRKDSEAFRRCDNLKVLIALKTEAFAEAKKVYYFIVDTNILIEDPEFIQKVSSKYKVIIPAKVLDELDKHKSNTINKASASKAIREIFADKNKNISRAKANTKLLPPDFNKKSPDNLILATALAYKHMNGIIITDDKGLHEKAKTVEMRVISYEEYLSSFLNPKK